MPLLDEQRELLWKRVVDRWTDDASHGAFLEYCQRTNALSDAAARYRGMAGDRDRGPEAQRRLQGVVLLATQAMVAQRSSPSPGAPRWILAVTAVLCSLSVGYTLFRLLRLGLARRGSLPLAILPVHPTHPEVLMKKLLSRFLDGAEDALHKAKEGVEDAAQRLKQGAEDLSQRAAERAKEKMVEEAKERLIEEAKQELASAKKQIARHLGLEDEPAGEKDRAPAKEADASELARFARAEEARREKERRARELEEAEAASRRKDEEKRKEREIDEELAALRRKLGKS